MPKYPAQIDNTQSLPTAVDNLTPVQGSIFNKLRDAVLAVESELGVKPSGSYTTVRSRLDTLEGIIGNLEIIELHKDLGGTLEEPKVIGIQGRPISTVAPSVGQVLAWNGIAWIPTTGSGGGGGGFNPPAGEFPGQTLVWDGTDYIPNFILADVIIPPYDQTLTSTIEVVEVNQEVIDPEFTATYELTPTEASITDDVFETPTDVTSTPTAFTSPHTYSKSAYGDIVTFTLTAQQGFVSKSVDYQIAWGQKVYYGIGPASQTGETFVKSLIGQPVVNDKNVGFGITSDIGDKVYYACRTAYGDMIFTIHSIEGWFTKTDTFDVTNDFGFTESYDLYESEDDNLGPVSIFVGAGMFQNGGGPIGPPGPPGPTGPTGPAGSGSGLPLSTVRFVDINTLADSPDGTIGSPFISIQDAVDDLVDGGTVYLIPGDYTSAVLDFSGKPINLVAMTSGPITSAPYLPNITTDVILSLTNIGQSIGDILSSAFVYLNNVRIDGNIFGSGLLANAFPDLNNICFLGGNITCDGVITINGYSVAGTVTSNIDSVNLNDSKLNNSINCNLLDAKNCSFNGSLINISGFTGKLVGCFFTNSTTITFTGAAGILSVDQLTFESMLNAEVTVINGFIHVLGVKPAFITAEWDATGTVTHTLLAGGSHPAGVYLVTSTIVVVSEADTGTLSRTVDWSTLAFGSDTNVLGSISAITTGTQLQNSLVVVSDGTAPISVTYEADSITGTPVINLYSTAILQGDFL